MMFHNDNLSTLSAENYTYCKIWDRDDRDRDRDRDDYCVIVAMVRWHFRGNMEVHI